MKILYAVQATGNGHISRAKQLLPYLEKFGKVDVFLSGSNATLSCPLPVVYKSDGLSLFYKECGGLDYFRMASSNSLLKAWKESRTLPVEKYDIIINDFEYITSRACLHKNKPSIQFGHQASFKSKLVPRPEKKSKIGEWILQRYAPASFYAGLHFEKYDDFIFPPVIKREILQSNPVDEGHITVYLPSYQKKCLKEVFTKLQSLHFHWFLPDISKVQKEKNITYYPIDNELFTKSLTSCHGIITGGGFETPAEALYLKKKLMCIPIKDHYEQHCNASALALLGVTILDDIYPESFAQSILNWLDAPPLEWDQKANDIMKTLEHVFDMFDV